MKTPFFKTYEHSITIQQEIAAHERRIIAASKNSSSTFRVLRALSLNGVMTTADVTETLELDKSVVSRVLSGMLKAGLLEIVQRYSDRRHKPVRMTEKGKKLFENQSKDIHGAVLRALETLPDSEQLVCKEGLRLFSKALQRVRVQDQYEIRPIKKGDTAEVARVIQQVLSEFGFDGSEFADYPEELSAPYETYKEKDSAYLVVVRGESIVGCAGIAPLENADKSICELRKMFLLSEARGCGMGRLLLNECLNEAKKRKYRQCYVETTSRMALGKLLFEKVGFTRCKKRLGLGRWPSCDEWYIKDLVD